MPARAAALVLAVAAAAALPAAPAAARDDGRREARGPGRCSAGARAELRLRSRDGAIAVEFRLTARRSGEAWRVVLVHERRVAWRGTVRTAGSSRAFRIRRALEDLGGPDQVTVRASGPAGRRCEAALTLPA